MKLLFGFITGILGSLLLYFSIQLDDNTIMDMRHIAIIIAAIYGGFISSIISATVISIARLTMFDISFSSITAVIGTILVVIMLGLINRLNISIMYKWILMLLISTGIYSGVLYILIGYLGNYFQILGYYWILSIVSGYVAYYFSNYITLSNQLNFEYKQQATVDFLTGLNNSRRFKTLIDELLTSANIKKQDLSLISFDIDNFKSINDKYGHPAGDKVLKEIGIIMNMVIRSQDLLFRIGGEEFSVIMLSTDANQALQSAERLRITIQKHPFILPDDTVINCSVSIGIATNRNFEVNSEEMIKKADEALYKAKNKGKNKVIVWEED